MFPSEFVWCDLSTYDVTKALTFYEKVFGWRQPVPDDSEDDYLLFQSSGDSVAGLFTMPESLQARFMPSFWMSYVHVEHLEDSLDLSISLGGTCEIEPTIYDANIHFCLIRDPAGAGLTLYTGPKLAGRDTQGRPGRMSWNELHVPNLGLVEAFYTRLFGWDIVDDPGFDHRHIVHSSHGVPIASILELKEAVKGPKNYWAIYFSVAGMLVTLQAIKDSGGTIVCPPNAEVGPYALVTDDQGAAFCLAPP